MSASSIRSTQTVGTAPSITTFILARVPRLGMEGVKLGGTLALGEGVVRVLLKSIDESREESGSNDI